MRLRHSTFWPLMILSLSACESKPTPEQVIAIERVDAAKAAHLREFQPLFDAMDRCAQVNSADYCGRQFAATPKPSSAQYDLALRMCLEQGVPYEYCKGERKY